MRTRFPSDAICPDFEMALISTLPTVRAVATFFLTFAIAGSLVRNDTLEVISAELPSA